MPRPIQLRPQHHPLQLVNTEALLASEVTYEVGFDVMIDCGDDEYLVAPIEGSFIVLQLAWTAAPSHIEVRLERQRQAEVEACRT